MELFASSLFCLSHKVKHMNEALMNICEQEAVWLFFFILFSDGITDLYGKCGLAL